MSFGKMVQGKASSVTANAKVGLLGLVLAGLLIIQEPTMVGGVTRQSVRT
jgi:hypothetical protein